MKRDDTDPAAPTDDEPTTELAAKIKRLVLERRARFVAAALTAAGLPASACDDAGSPPAQEVGGTGQEVGGTGQEVGGTGGLPQVCLTAPPPAGSGATGGAGAIGGPGIAPPDAGPADEDDASALPLPCLS